MIKLEIKGKRWKNQYLKPLWRMSKDQKKHDCSDNLASNQEVYEFS
jgi:hypothetical protein